MIKFGFGVLGLLLSALFGSFIIWDALHYWDWPKTAFFVLLFVLLIDRSYRLVKYS